MAPFKYRESGFARLDKVLNLCEKHDLYVILDLHAAQGWQNVHWHSDNASRISLLWRDASYQDRYVALWKEFARRIFERSGAHWTTWNYKDIGVMGTLTLNPESLYMEWIKGLLSKKRALGTDDWMRWLPTTLVKDSTAQLAEQIRQVVNDPQINPVLNAKSMSQVLLCFYAGTLMQPMYASLFKGLSETELDHILSSFSPKQCIPNQGLIDMLSKYMAMGV